MKKHIYNLLLLCAVLLCGMLICGHSVKAADPISIRAAYYYLNDAGETIEHVVTIDNVDPEINFIEFYDTYMKAGIKDLKDLKTPSYWCSFPLAGREEDGWEYSESKIYQANYTVDYFAVYPGYTWAAYGYELAVVPKEKWLDSGTGFMCCMPDNPTEKQVNDAIYAAAQNCSWIREELDFYKNFNAYLYRERGEWSYPYYILEIDASSVNISASKKKLYVGQNDFTLSFVNLPEITGENDAFEVIWESKNPKIASVDENGVVTAKKKGTTVITGTCAGTSFTCKVTVADPAISKDKASLKVKKTLKLKVYGTEVKSWSSSNPKIAKVSTAGKVTALKAGTTTITAKCANGKTYTCTITVTK